MRLIASGLRWQDGDVWRTVAKNKDDIPEDAPLELLNDAEARYVSRGGLSITETGRSYLAKTAPLEDAATPAKARRKSPVKGPVFDDSDADFDPAA